MTRIARSGYACPHEVELQQAAASGRWPAWLEAHSRACATCADIRLITEAFVLAPIDAAPPVTTDPALLFARARQERRLRAEVRISLVATASQIAVLLGVLGVALAFLPVPASPAWPDVLSWPPPAEWPAMPFAMPTGTGAWTYGALAFVMASLFLLARWNSQDA